MLNWKCFVYSAVRACINTKAAIDESLCDILVDEKPNLNIIQLFLDRCHKHRFISSAVSVKDLLYRQDC